MVFSAFPWYIVPACVSFFLSQTLGNSFWEKNKLYVSCLLFNAKTDAEQKACKQDSRDDDDRDYVATNYIATLLMGQAPC